MGACGETRLIHPMIPEPLAARIQSTGIVAVLVIDKEEDAPLARALLAGAGTVLTPAQVTEVKIAGAEFVVSPFAKPAGATSTLPGENRC